MPVRKLHGYLPGKTMPDHLRALLGKVRAFADVKLAFAKKDASAGAGTDHIIPNEPPCFDQGDMGSCVLNAWVGAICVLLAVEGLPFTMLARLFLYWLCRLYQGSLNEDSGTYVHLAVERGGTIGVPPESMWPYDDAHFLDANGKAVPPSPDCFPAASDNRPTAWFQIADDASLDDIEMAVRANHPVQFGGDVDAAIQSYQKGDVLTTPDPNAIIGGHSMLVTGVKFVNGKRLWWVRNSWGVDYGDDGHLLADDGFMATMQDRWVLTRADAQEF